MKPKPVYYPLVALALGPVSGVLFALALPPRDIAVLGWIAFLPLLVASRLCNRSMIAAGIGLLAGAACGAVAAGRWNNPAQAANIVAGFGALALVLALVAGGSSWASRRLSPIKWALFVACVAVAAELASTHVFPVNVAICQHANLAALRLASFTGIWGVSFLLWLMPASVVALAIEPRSAWKLMVSALALLAVATIGSIPRHSGGPRIQVAAVQSMCGDNCADLTRKIGHQGQFVVWPELLLDPHDRAPYDAAKAAGVYVIADYEKPSSTKPYNTARVISPQGNTVTTYYKRHLFGKENFTRRVGADSLPVNVGGVVVGAAICFDTEFTNVVRRLASEGARVVFVPNEDPEVPSHVLGYLHAAIIPFRAAENGVPIVWSECNAHSMVVDGTGRVISCAPDGAQASVVGSVYARARRTLFTVLGDYFAWVCSAAAAVMLFCCFRTRPFLTFDIQLFNL